MSEGALMNEKFTHVAAIFAFVAALMLGAHAWAAPVAKPPAPDSRIEFVHAKKKAAELPQTSKASAARKAAKPAARGGAHTHPPRS
jgi:hypothetical protein